MSFTHIETSEKTYRFTNTINPYTMSVIKWPIRHIQPQGDVGRIPNVRHPPLNAWQSWSHVLLLKAMKRQFGSLELPKRDLQVGQRTNKLTPLQTPVHLPTSPKHVIQSCISISIRHEGHLRRSVLPFVSTDASAWNSSEWTIWDYHCQGMMRLACRIFIRAEFK